MKGKLITCGGCLPYNPDLNQRARELRNHLTFAENMIWTHFLRKHKFTFQRQKPINHFIVDFYCSTIQLVIEIDGDSHFTDESKIYDEERTAILNGYGLKVLRFTNKEVIESFKKVCEAIEKEIGERINIESSIE